MISFVCVIEKVEVGLLATEKKSSDCKCFNKLACVSPSRSSTVIVFMSIVKVPPTSLLLASKSRDPLVSFTVQKCAPPTFFAFQVIVEVAMFASFVRATTAGTASLVGSVG